MCGLSISHPSLTISFLGFGRISQETLKRLLVFTNKQHPPSIQYLSSRARPNQSEIDAEFSKTFGVDVKRVEKDQLAKEADIVIVLCDQNPNTVNLVNKEFLGKMKKSAVLINAARVSQIEALVARYPSRRRNHSKIKRLCTGPDRQLGGSSRGTGTRRDLRSRSRRDHW
jgi:lactate dehydrogenase-like 2-hydroxyacid dehydrogenase